MFDWDLFLTESALASVLPGDFARFAKPIREGLIVFLNGLPSAQQAEIVAAQMALPLGTGISERLAFLARSCPVLQKLGQVLARDQRLAPELREHLRALESLPPSVSDATIEAIVARELGSLNQLGIRLSPPAIAEASVAVVIPFSRQEADPQNGRADGVFKVLKPGIEERLATELELMGKVGAHLDERCEELRIPRLQYEESFEHIREKLGREVRLDEEQRHLSQAFDAYADEPLVQIPALLEFCSPRITAMERIYGSKVTDHCLDKRRDRRHLAALVVRALICQPIFSRADQAMFHSDPHAGNLLLTDDHRLAILDWSLVGSLGAREREAIAQVMLFAATLDEQGVAEVLASLTEGATPAHNVVASPLADRPALLSVVRSKIQQIRRGTFPGLSWLTGLLDDAVLRARLRFPADLLLFRKSMHTLDGVVEDISSGALRADGVLMSEFVRHFAREWPRRWISWPGSTDFATRLSNIALTRAAWSYPATVARFWLGHGRDLLEACARQGGS